MRIMWLSLMTVLVSYHGWADPILDSAKKSFREQAQSEQQRHQKVMDGLTNTLLRAYGDARKRALQTGKTDAYDQITAEMDDFQTWLESGGLASQTSGWEQQAPSLTSQLLTEMKSVSASALGGESEVLFNTYPFGSKPTIDGKPCDNFIFAHAPSSVRFNVPIGMNHFSAVCGSFRSPTVKFKVIVNGRTLYESPMLSTVDGGLAKVDIKLPPGKKTLDLVVDDCGDKKSDHSYWANPTVSRLTK